MTKIDYRDRRVFERYSTSLPLQYVSNPSRVKGFAHTIDMSANGIGMLSKRGLPLHMPLDLWVDVPDSPSPFYTRGEVEWVKWVWFGQYRIGIALQRVDLMGISRTINKLTESTFGVADVPFPSAWEHIKLNLIYYKTVFLKLCGLK